MNRYDIKFGEGNGSLSVLKEQYVLIVVHARLGNFLFQLSAGLKYAKDNYLNFYWTPLCTEGSLDYKHYIESNTLLDNLLRNLKDSYIGEECYISRSDKNSQYHYEGLSHIYKYGFTENAFIYKPIPKGRNIILFGQFYNKSE